MSVIRIMKSRRTWREFFQVFIQTCMADKKVSSFVLDTVMNTYGVGRIKEKINIGGADQAMLKSRSWAKFLSNGDNKTEKIQFIADNCKVENFERKLKIPVTTTCGENTWLLDTAGVQQFPLCKHHKADTRIIGHTIQFNDSNLVVVFASDTGILVLLIYAIDRLSFDNIPHRVQMKIDDNLQQST